MLRTIKATGTPHIDGFCPRCGTTDPNILAIYPALSRTDNKTYICSPCGTDEGMQDWCGVLASQKDWYEVGLLAHIRGEGDDRTEAWRIWQELHPDADANLKAREAGK